MADRKDEQRGEEGRMEPVTVRVGQSMAVKQRARARQKLEEQVNRLIRLVHPMRHRYEKLADAAFTTEQIEALMAEFEFLMDPEEERRRYAGLAKRIEVAQRRMGDIR